MASIVAEWEASYAPPAGFAAVPSVSASLQVPVANAGGASRNWLFAFVALRQPSGFTTSVTIGDDGGNFWEPVGIPGGSSSGQAGPVRVSVWRCVNAAAAANVYAAPDGLYESLAVRVVEVSGLLPYGAMLDGVTAYTTAITPGMSLVSDTPAAQVLFLSAIAVAAAETPSSGPGTGWTAITPVAASNGTDTSGDLTLCPYWQVSSSQQPADWVLATGAIAAAIITGTETAGTPPAAPSRNWPYTSLQIAFGGGAATPWDQLDWSDVTDRFRKLQSGRGKQYELDVVQAGTQNWSLANQDGALTPGNAASPYSPGVQVFTPIRLLAGWPPPPAAGIRIFVVARGFMERWPNQLTGARYQNMNAVSDDVWALLTTLQQTVARSTVLNDQPHAYWPCSDLAGATSAANLASGSSTPLQVAASKYGAGTATQTFGVTASGLDGDPGTSVWQQQNVPAAGNLGYALVYQPSDPPLLGGGITFDIWCEMDAAQVAAGKLGIITMARSRGVMIRLYVDAATGHVLVDRYDTSSGAVTTSTVLAESVLTGTWVYFALAADTTTWTAYVNAGSFAAVSGGSNLDESPWWVSFCGQADRIATGGFWNGKVAHPAVTPRKLSQSRLTARYYSMLTGFAGADTAAGRAERLLQDGQAPFPRLVPGTTDPAQSAPVVGAVDIGGQAVSQNVTNVVESDGGLMLVTGSGYIQLITREGGYNLPESWVLGEQPAQPLNARTSFSDGTGPWTASGGTIGQSQSWGWRGSASVTLTPSGTAPDPQLVSEAIPVTAGESYSFAPWCLISGAAWPVTAILAWYSDTAGTVPLSQDAGTVVTLAPGLPDQPPVTGRAPAGAVSMRLVIQMNGTPSGAVVLAADQTAGTTAYTEQPYLPDVTTGYDISQVFNDVTAMQLTSPVIETYQFTASASGSLFTAAGSALAAGQEVTLSGSGLPGGFSAAVTYYVVNPAGAGFQLAAAKSGTPITVTSSGSGTLTAVVKATGATIALTSPASIRQFGDQTLQQTAYLADTDTLTDMVNWILEVYGTPRTRVTQLTFDPASNPSLWPLVLSLEAGQAVRFLRRTGPGSGGTVQIDGQFQVMTVGHNVSPGAWQTRVTLVYYPGSVLTCDDTTRGVLNGTNPLGW